MTGTNRRTLLTALAAAAVGTGLVSGPGAASARAATKAVDEPSYTALYKKYAGQEGTTFGRRYQRHERGDTDLAQGFPFARTTILALHGGGVEPGTSELCLGIAGYRPDTLTPATPGAPLHDYWMFEGLLDSGNSALHVTSTDCDDKVALSLAGGSLNVLSVHGCADGDVHKFYPLAPAESIVVGGLNKAFKALLHEELKAAGFATYDGDVVTHLAGIRPENPCNRTLLGMGAQLELTNSMRKALFLDGGFTREKRPTHTHPETYPKFVAAVRRAITRLEARPEQVVL